MTVGYIMMAKGHWYPFTFTFTGAQFRGIFFVLGHNLMLQKKKVLHAIFVMHIVGLMVDISNAGGGYCYAKKGTVWPF